jgi:hypothetical protein
MNQTNFELIITDDMNILKINFEGLLTHKTTLIAIQKWKEIFGQYPEQKFTLIFNSLKMSDYEQPVRLAVQETLILLKKQVASIWVITDSKVVAAGVGLVSMFTSFKIKMVTSEDKIDNTFNTHKSILNNID